MTGNINVKIKEFKKDKVELDSGDKTIDVKIEEQKDIPLDKWEKDKPIKIKVKWRESKKDQKDNEGWQDAENTEAKLQEHFFADDFKITQIGTNKLKGDGISVSPSGISTINAKAWITIFVVVAAIIGVIWWWIASNKKEDKEEESL